MRERTLDVVAAGHISFDMTPQFRKSSYRTLDEVLIPGKLIQVDQPTIATGGTVSNAGLALFKLGVKVEFMAKVGDDMFGNAIIEMLNNKTGRICRGITRNKNASSSYTVCIAVPGIDRIFLHHPGTNDTFGYRDVDFEVVKKTKMFSFGYPPLMRKLYLHEGEELVRIFKKVKSLGVTTVMDLALPDPASEAGRLNWNIIFKKVLPYVDIFFPSIEETLYMIDPKKHGRIKEKAVSRHEDMVDHLSGADVTSLSDTLLDYGAAIVGLKCSHRGCYVRTAGKASLGRMGVAKPGDMDAWANRELWAPSYHVKNIVSALGSGDSAYAGFLTAFLKGKSVEETLRCANIVGAQSLRAYDASGGIGTWKDVECVAKKRDAKFNPLTIATPGWRRANNNNLWRGPHDGK